MTESKNSVNIVLKIVTAIAIIVTICAILWAYKLNTKCDQMNDEIVHLESTINILDVQLEYCEKSLDSYSIRDKNSDLPIKERLDKAREELDVLKALNIEVEALEDIRSKENMKP